MEELSSAGDAVLLDDDGMTFGDAAPVGENVDEDPDTTVLDRPLE